MNAGNFCARNVDTATGKENVLVAARRMNDRNVGSLIVVNDHNRPIGIVTDRDFTVRSLAKSLDPARTLLANVMTENPRSHPKRRR